MQIIADTAQAGGGLLFEMDLGGRDQPLLPLAGVIVEFSDEALALLAQNPPGLSSAPEPDWGAVAQESTIEALDQRIATVRQQIAAVWNSSLPDDEKERQISSLQTEISLLQAGQYTIVKSGFRATA